MNDYKELADKKSKKNSEVEYIASRLSSIMETYKKLLGQKCAQ